MSIRSLFLTVSLAGIFTAIGCQKRIETGPTVFEVDQNDYQMNIVLDLSGSFLPMMAENGKAFQFVQMVIDKYFRDRIGTNDRIVIAQISASNRPMLWEGTPLSLRRDFPTPEKFRDFLLSKANPNGSRVYEGLGKSLAYLTDSSGTSTSAKKAVFVLSDMLDNATDSAVTQDEAVNVLARISKEGGVIGMYYVDQNEVLRWRELLRNAGAKNFCIESEIVGRPNLPNFE